MAIKKKLAVYCRVSTSKQEKSGLSLPQQEERGREWAEKEGYGCPSIYKDGESGSTFSRSGWMQLLDDVEAGAIDAIWVYKNDRFGRNSRESFNNYHFVTEHGVSFYIDGEEVTENNEDVFFKFELETILSARERRLIRRRTREAKIDEKNLGKIRFCYVYGYDLKYSPDGSKEWIVNEKEKEAVIEIYKWFRDGLSTTKITDRLNESGYEPKRPKRKRQRRVAEWEPSAVHRILKRIEYTGMTYNSNGEIIPHKFYTNEFVTLEYWEKTQAIWKQRSAEQAVRGRPPLHPMSNLIKCSRCGKGYNYHEHYDPRKKKDHIYHHWRRTYMHKVDTRFDKKRCDFYPKSIDYYLLNYIGLVIYQRALNPDVVENALIRLRQGFRPKKSEYEEGLQRLARELQELHESTERWVSVVDSGVNLAIAVERLKELQETIQKKETAYKSLKVKMETEEAFIDATATDFALLKGVEYFEAENQGKRELLKEIVSSAYIEDGPILVFRILNGVKFRVDLEKAKKDPTYIRIKKRDFQRDKVIFLQEKKGVSLPLEEWPNWEDIYDAETGADLGMHNGYPLEPEELSGAWFRGELGDDFFLNKALQDCIEMEFP